MFDLQRGLLVADGRGSIFLVLVLSQVIVRVLTIHNNEKIKQVFRVFLATDFD